MEFESPERCTAATFTRDGAAVAAAYEDGSLRLFDLDAIAIKWTVTHHAAPIIGLAVDRAGTAVLAASRDGTLTVTEVAIGALQGHTRDLVDTLRGAPLEGFAASPVDGALIAAAWSAGFAVLAAPWQHAPVRELARYEAPDADADTQVRCLSTSACASSGCGCVASVLRMRGTSMSTGKTDARAHRLQCTGKQGDMCRMARRSWHSCQSGSRAPPSPVRPSAARSSCSTSVPPTSCKSSAYRR